MDFLRMFCVNTRNIVFAKGGAHLPIAYTHRLLPTQELRFGLTKLKFRRKKERKNLARGCFLGGGAIFFDFEIEKK